MLARWGAFSLVLSLIACRTGNRNANPRSRTPQPSVQEAPEAADTTPSPFETLAETTPDAQVLRYEVPAFTTLGLEERKLLFFLQEAALSGRDILYDQRYAHNLAVRRTVETVLATYRGDRTTEAFHSLSRYAKRIWFASGIHHPATGTKILPEKLTAADFARLVRQSDVSRLPLPKGQTVAEWTRELTPVVFDPTVAPRARARGPGTDPIADSPTHFYVGVTQAEASRFYAKAAQNQASGQITPGLNSRLSKQGAKLVESTYRTEGLYGEALEDVVHWLKKAHELSRTEEQAQALDELVAFYQSGDLRRFDSYRGSWTADAKSEVNAIQGFLGTHDDPVGRKGSYGALVWIVDRAATRRVESLAAQAQWFEDHSPVDSTYRRSEVEGVSAQVIQAVVAAGHYAPELPSGLHLPDSSWGGHAHGSRALILGNVLKARAQARHSAGVLSEFVLGTHEERRAREYGALAYELLVELHEVIGHATGKLADTPPQKALREYTATIEEARADLHALYFLFEPKLIELRLMPHFDVARAAYDDYVRTALLLSLTEAEPGEQVDDPHVLAARMIVQWARDQDSPTIRRVDKDAKAYFEISDYMGLRRRFGELLAELQRITWEGDLAAARKLIETYANPVDRVLHEQIRLRHSALQVPTRVAFVQPRLVPVGADDDPQDVQLSYPRDFQTQQLQDARRYHALPTYNE